MADSFLRALDKEIVLQKDYLVQSRIETIYIGGGTPSVLTAPQIRGILESITNVFDVSQNAEITMEANPDDITGIYARDLKKAGINRISLGIQSWNNDVLKLLNRRHTVAEAEKALLHLSRAGIDNISADLIYGIPGMTGRQWTDDLKHTFSFDIKHLSAYHLTLEEGTVFGKMTKLGEMKEIDEEESEKQFNILTAVCKKQGFIQYEISNFCKEGYFSVHNTNYWKQQAYLGLGPAAHSYNGGSRQWNISDITGYISSIERNELPATVENLGIKERYNEYIMTSLRTMWGIDPDFVEDNINKESRDYLNNLASRFLKYGMLTKKDNKLVLTDQGKMISDNIISELMMD